MNEGLWYGTIAAMVIATIIAGVIAGLVLIYLFSPPNYTYLAAHARTAGTAITSIAAVG